MKNTIEITITSKWVDADTFVTTYDFEETLTGDVVFSVECQDATPREITEMTANTVFTFTTPNAVVKCDEEDTIFLMGIKKDPFNDITALKEKSEDILEMLVAKLVEDDTEWYDDIYESIEDFLKYKANNYGLNEIVKWLIS